MQRAIKKNSWHMLLLFRFLNLQTQHTGGWADTDVDTDPALQYVKLLSDVA